MRSPGPAGLVVMSRFENIAKGLGTVVFASVVIILLSIVYFVVTAWIVSFGANVATGNQPSADFVALAAAILTFGGLAGSSVRAMGPTESSSSGDDDYAGQEVA